MWRWLSTNPGMTIMPAASMTWPVGLEAAAHRDDPIVIDQHVAGAEIADLGIRLSTIPLRIRTCGRSEPREVDPSA